MHLRYDEDLVEAVVFQGASGRLKGIPGLQIARFNREREKLYSIPDPDERNNAFFRLHGDWFREWGMERRLTEPLKMTSCIDSPRSSAALLSPSTQRTASMTFDLPQPLGPTTPTRLPGTSIWVGSTNDLNPASLICRRRT